MKITSLMTGRSLEEELLDLEEEQKALLKRCRELEASAAGRLFVKDVPPAASWKNEEGKIVLSDPKTCFYHRFKDPLTSKTVVRKLGPHDEALKERIKLSLLCKKMIPFLEYNTGRLEAARKSIKDPQLSELEAKLSAVYGEIGISEGAFPALTPEK